jgi:phage terminase large subunit-like protein
MSGDKMVKDGEEGMFISNFWLDQATNSFNLVKSMLEERIDTIKSLKNKLEGRDTRVLELLTEVTELRSTLEERDALSKTIK